MENKRLTDIRKRIYNYELDYSRDEISKIICKLGQLEDLEEQIGFPLEVLYWLWQDEPIFVLNPIDKSLQEIEHPLNYYIPIKQAFDIRNELFKTTYEKRIWNTGGVIIYLKDYKKTWWLKEDRSE